MNTNILFVGLNYPKVGLLAKLYADQTEKMFLDINALIEYTLIDKENVQLKLGDKYISDQENKIAMSSIEYENVVINFPHNLIFQNNNTNKLKKNCLIIYVYENISSIINDNEKKGKNEKLDIEILSFEDKDKLLQNFADIKITLDTNDLSVQVNKLQNLIKEHFIK